MSARRVDASGGPWEDAFGYARAVRVGDQVHVSGCTAVVDGAVAHPGDAGAQALVALDPAMLVEIELDAVVTTPQEQS